MMFYVKYAKTPAKGHGCIYIVSVKCEVDNSKHIYMIDIPSDLEYDEQEIMNYIKLELNDRHYIHSALVETCEKCDIDFTPLQH